MPFQYGIEHEVAFLNRQGDFSDFSNTPFSDFEAMIEMLPLYESDYPQLRIGDAGIKLKRWYIEGYERYNDQGIVTSCSPKGIEIRTTIHNSIDTVLDEFVDSYQCLQPLAKKKGYTPVLTSFNPYKKAFEPTPPLTPFEQQRREGSPEKQTADIPMLTYGPDLSLSKSSLSVEAMIDTAKKLTYYSPWLVPFSFSSPFYQGKLWEGLSVRTWHRTGARPSTMVFLNDHDKMINSNPSLTQIARVPRETGRIEFKAFDTCANVALYAALFALLKGLILDKTLMGRALVPDKKQHQQAALFGFHDDEIWVQSNQLVTVASKALGDDPDRGKLDYLFTMLSRRETPADVMKKHYQETGSIKQTLLKMMSVDYLKLIK